MGQYVYSDPLNRGYKQFKLTRKQHNKLFPKRKIQWNDKFEYYYNEEGIVLQRFGSWQAVIVIILLFPVYLLLEGLSNTKGIVADYKGVFNQKKYGAFTSDYVWSGTDTYNEIMKIINEKGKI